MNPYGNFPYFILLSSEPEVENPNTASLPGMPTIGNRRIAFQAPQRSERLPRHLLRLPLNLMKVGEEGWVGIGALAIDSNGNGWLDSNERIYYSCSYATPILVRKDEVGFIADLSKLSSEIISSLPIIDKEDWYNKGDDRKDSIVEMMTGRKLRSYEEPVVEFVYNL